LRRTGRKASDGVPGAPSIAAGHERDPERLLGEEVEDVLQALLLAGGGGGCGGIAD
jgi:hypothetical protein